MHWSFARGVRSLSMPVFQYSLRRTGLQATEGLLNRKALVQTAGIEPASHRGAMVSKRLDQFVHVCKGAGLFPAANLLLPFAGSL